MSWRKFEDHRTESKEVKRFLINKGYQNVRVGHDRGTAWGWLSLHLCISKPANCYCQPNRPRQIDKCHPCKNKWQDEYAKIGREVMEFTGRTGDYGGRIGIDIDWIENNPEEMPQSKVDQVLSQILS
jgi:hypothetical protein